MDLIDVLAVPAGGGNPSRVRAATNLVTGAFFTASLPSGTGEALPVYAVPPAPAASLDEIRSVVDEVTANVIFVDLINYAEQGLERIALSARLGGVPGTLPVRMEGNPGRGAVELVLPLTTYLTHRTLEFEVGKTFSDGKTEATPWLAWDTRARRQRRESDVEHDCGRRDGLTAEPGGRQAADAARGRGT